jgi:hypothetical protein
MWPESYAADRLIAQVAPENFRSLVKYGYLKITAPTPQLSQ